MDTQEKIKAATVYDRLEFLESIVWYDKNDPSRPHHKQIENIKDRLDLQDLQFIVWANDGVTSLADAYASLRKKWRRLDAMLTKDTAIDAVKMTAINAFIAAISGSAAGIVTAWILATR